MLTQTNTVIITGAGKGIGYELTKSFLLNPAFLVIAISRNVSQLELLNNSRLTIIKGDLLSDYSSITASIKQAAKTITHLINNAAQVHNASIEKTSDEILKEVMETNFHVPYKLIRDLEPLFISGTHIINISSMSGFQGSKKFKGLSLYSSSKAALASLTECVAEEWTDRKIFCNCLALGSVDTDMIRISIPGVKPSVSACQMATYIYDFAIKGHNYYNGQVLPVSLTTL
jgi:NAD(P)-dependent dehydrogenase (short-subunit alcohol dehydrogenase family)